MSSDTDCNQMSPFNTNRHVNIQAAIRKQGHNTEINWATRNTAGNKRYTFEYKI